METEKLCPNCRKPLPPDVPLGLCPECLIKSGFPTESGTGGTGEAAGSRFTPPPVEEIAALFPQLEILGLIGQGGMGAVYKARQPALDRMVALKVLPPAVAGDPGFAERFNREARALARLNHPNIVAVHDFGKAGPLHFLIMEFVDGANLREVERAGRLSPEQALAIVPQICEALHFAHSEGIVHRDIKPENLLMDKKGRVKITDFGIAKMVGLPAGKVSLTGAKDVVGTPHYMAPEQIEKPQTVDHRADIYSLGVVFYEMLTGELPLGKFQPPSHKVQVDVRLDEVVLHALEKEPSRRYQQASHVKTDVETISGTPPPAAGFAAKGGPPPLSATPAGRASSDKIILPALLLAFFFGVVGAHRFYVGKTRTAILQLAALGWCIFLIIVCATMGYHVEPVAGILLGFSIFGCTIWATIDWILILCSAFTDGQGRRITNWFHPASGDPGARVNPPSGPPPVPPSAGAAPFAAGPPMPPLAPARTLDAGTAKIMAPAAGLMVAGFLKLLSALTAVVIFCIPGSPLGKVLQDIDIGFHFNWGVLAGVGILLKAVPACLICFGGLRMLKLQSYAWAVAASILAIVSCSFVGFPVGIWALIILTRQDVRDLFAKAPVSPHRQTGNGWKWVVGATALAGVIVIGVAAAGLIAWHHSRGQPNVTVRGSVTDALTGKPIARALVADNHYGTAPNRPAQQAWTDKSGRYKLNTWYEEHTIMASAPGYNYGLNTLLTKPFRRESEVRMDFKLRPSDQKTPVTNGSSSPALNISSQNGQVVIETTNGRLSADKVQLQVDANGSTTVTAQKIKYDVTAAVAGPSNPPAAEKGEVPPPGPPPPAPNAPVLAQSTFTSSDDAETISKVFAVTPGGKLSVDTDRGDIEVVPSDRNEVAVLVTREVTGAGKNDVSQILKNHQVTLIQNGNQIQIRAKSPKNAHDLWSALGLKPKLNVSLQLTVPRNCDVNLNTAGGDVSVAGGEGKIEVGTSGGDLKLSDIQGPVQAHTSGGDILAADCAGSLRLHTSGGDIQIKNFSGSVFSAETSGGDVALDLVGQIQTNCLLRTSGGSVTARLPASIAIFLDANTGGGEISTRLPVQIEGKKTASTLRGTINGGGPVLSLQTSGGDIEVLRR